MSEVSAASLLRLGSQKGQRTALGAGALAQSFLDNLFFVQGRSVERATVNDLYMAPAYTVRDRILERWIATVKSYRAQDVRVVCYLSAEFLNPPADCQRHRNPFHTPRTRSHWSIPSELSRNSRIVFVVTSECGLGEYLFCCALYG